MAAAETCNNANSTSIWCLLGACEVCGRVECQEKMPDWSIKQTGKGLTWQTLLWPLCAEFEREWADLNQTKKRGEKGGMKLRQKSPVLKWMGMINWYQLWCARDKTSSRLHWIKTTSAPQTYPDNWNINVKDLEEKERGQIFNGTVTAWPLGRAVENTYFHI